MLQISDLSPIQFVNTFTLQVSADPKRMESRELQKHASHRVDRR